MNDPLISYTVHSLAPFQASVAAKTASGRTVAALVPGLVVELVDGVPHGHGHTFRFVPADAAEMAALKERFAIGNKITASFALAAKE